MARDKQVHQIAVSNMNKLERTNAKITLDDVAMAVGEDLNKIREGEIDPKVGEVLMKGWGVVKDIVKEARRKNIEEMEAELKELLKNEVAAEN